MQLTLYWLALAVPPAFGLLLVIWKATDRFTDWEPVVSSLYFIGIVLVIMGLIVLMVWGADHLYDHYTRAEPIITLEK